MSDPTWINAEPLADRRLLLGAIEDPDGTRRPFVTLSGQMVAFRAAALMPFSVRIAQAMTGPEGSVNAAGLTPALIADGQDLLLTIVQDEHPEITRDELFRHVNPLGMLQALTFMLGLQEVASMARTLTAPVLEATTQRRNGSHNRTLKKSTSST